MEIVFIIGFIVVLVLFLNVYTELKKLTEHITPSKKDDTTSDVSSDSSQTKTLNSAKAIVKEPEKITTQLVVQEIRNTKHDEEKKSSIKRTRGNWGYAGISQNMESF